MADDTRHSKALDAELVAELAGGDAGASASCDL